MNFIDTTNKICCEILVLKLDRSIFWNQPLRIGVYMEKFCWWFQVSENCYILLDEFHLIVKSETLPHYDIHKYFLTSADESMTDMWCYEGVGCNIDQ
jgi:hypothetical protein